MNQTSGVSEVYEPRGVLPPGSDEPDAQPSPEPPPIANSSGNTVRFPGIGSMAFAPSVRGTTDDLRATVARLATLDAVDYIQQRDLEANNLGIKAADLNVMVRYTKRAQKAAQDEAKKRAKEAQDEAEKQATAAAAAQAAAAQKAAGSKLKDLVAEFNKRYMIVNEAGKALIYEPAFNSILQRRYHNRLGFEDFKKLHLNRTVEVTDKFGNPVPAQAASAWLHHQRRRQYIHGVTFDPSGNHQDPQVLNLWQEFQVVPKVGDWSLMKQHIFEVICASSHEHHDYVMSWMARMLQFPDQQGEVAIVLKGTEGTGKGLLARALLRILGQHALAISHAKHLTGNFNAHLRDCVFLFADEAFFAGDKAHVGVLKALITEPALTIEAKYANAVQAPNYVHVLMASNEDWVVPASISARQFMVLLTAATKVGNRPYFKAILNQMETGGYEAMLEELLHRDLTNFNVRDVPDSEGLQEQKKLSLGIPENWWMDVLQRGYVYKSKYGLEDHFGQWRDFETTEVLFASYSEFAKTRNERRLMTREALGTFMGKMAGGRPRRRRNVVIGEHMTDVPINQSGSEKRRQAKLITKASATGYLFGTLEDAQSAFCDATKLPVDWETDLEEADE